MVRRLRTEAMEVGTCLSGRMSPAGSVARGYGRFRELLDLEALLRGKKTPLGDQKAVSGDAQTGVVMKAEPAPPFEVAQADLLLEVAVIMLDAPASLGGGGEVCHRGVGRHRRQPVLGGFCFPVRPLDQ